MHHLHNFGTILELKKKKNRKQRRTLNTAGEILVGETFRTFDNCISHLGVSWMGLQICRRSGFKL